MGLPLAIVLIVPMCLLSALAGVWIVGGDNNIMTQIGLIVLIGLACKNAILLVEFARESELRESGVRSFSCVSHAFASGADDVDLIHPGVWPLVAATGAGAELRHATGITVFAGMIGVTGLILTPAFYSFEKYSQSQAHRKLSHRVTSRHEAPTATLSPQPHRPFFWRPHSLALSEAIPE